MERQRRNNTITGLLLFAPTALILTSCTGPTPVAERAGDYSPISAIVESTETSLREPFEMTPQETHEYWESPESFNFQPILDHVDPEGAVGEHGGDAPTGAFVAPPDGMQIGDESLGLGDESRGVLYEPTGYTEGATGRLYMDYQRCAAARL